MMRVVADASVVVKWLLPVRDGEAAQGGDALGQAMLAWCYLSGTGVAKDMRAARQWYERAAQQGLDAGQNGLAFMLAEGLGGARDDARAFRLYRDAAQQGHVDSMFGLALMYDEGRGTARDVGEAFRLFHLAAEKGHDAARRLLERTGRLAKEEDFFDPFKRPMDRR